MFSSRFYPLPSALRTLQNENRELAKKVEEQSYFHLYVELCHLSKNKAEEQLHIDFLSTTMLIVDCPGGPTGEAECPLCLPVPTPYSHLSYLFHIEI